MWNRINNNAKNTLSNTHIPTYSLLLVKIHMGPAKFLWDPPEPFLGMRKELYRAEPPIYGGLNYL